MTVIPIPQRGGGFTSRREAPLSSEVGEHAVTASGDNWSAEDLLAAADEIEANGPALPGELAASILAAADEIAAAPNPLLGRAK